jgi:hypothetical protein
MSKAGEKAKRIIHFFCRPCAEYHLKTHPHYRAMKRRKAKRDNLPTLGTGVQIGEISADLQRIMDDNSRAVEEMIATKKESC